MCGPCHEEDVLAALFRTDDGAPYLVWSFWEGFLEEAEFQTVPKGSVELARRRGWGRVFQVAGTADAEAQR